MFNFFFFFFLQIWIFAENSGLHVFSFLANSILKEVLLAIQKGKPGAFSPGRPAEFLKNYKASLNFLDYLEGSEEVKHVSNICCSMTLSLLMYLIITLGYCPSRSAVSKFRMEPIFVEFMKQWNTGVYFSLRYMHWISLCLLLTILSSKVPHSCDSNKTK